MKVECTDGCCDDGNDRKHKWEIEPHPYDSDFDVMVTDDDGEALEALQTAAELVWDGMEAGEEKVLKIRCNAVGKS